MAAIDKHTADGCYVIEMEVKQLHYLHCWRYQGTIEIEASDFRSVK